MNSHNLLTQLAEWDALNRHFQDIVKIVPKTLYEANKAKYQSRSIQAAGLFLDFSRNHITQQTIDLLLALAVKRKLSQSIEDLFCGNIVNHSEGQPALHTLLRDWNNNHKLTHHSEELLSVEAERNKLILLSGELRKGLKKGYSGKSITDIVNLGIGGSIMGPKLVYDALRVYSSKKIKCHFVSNLDEDNLLDVLQLLNPETTAFVVTSKSCTTKETLLNAERAKKWLFSSMPDLSAIMRQFYAVTANDSAAIQFGIPQSQIFRMNNWVGGRYSVWSSVGFPVITCFGEDIFREFLSGAHEMDDHFQNSKFHNNFPVMLGLLSIWYVNFFKINNRAIIPYSYRLRYYLPYLQQLFMESLGKSKQQDGSPVDYDTGPIVWGGIGSDSQHSFHQLLLQGTQQTLIDFILPMKSASGDGIQVELMANCLAQSQTLMKGSSQNEFSIFQYIPGNQPSNLIFFDKLTPYTLGALIALYEHVVFVQAAIWNINPFDQWGVDCGKKMSQTIENRFKQSFDMRKSSFDCSHIYELLR